MSCFPTLKSTTLKSNFARRIKSFESGFSPFFAENNTDFDLFHRKAVFSGSTFEVSHPKGEPANPIVEVAETNIELSGSMLEPANPKGEVSNPTVEAADSPLDPADRKVQPPSPRFEKSYPAT